MEKIAVCKLKISTSYLSTVFLSGRPGGDPGGTFVAEQGELSGTGMTLLPYCQLNFQGSSVCTSLTKGPRTFPLGESAAG